MQIDNTNKEFMQAVDIVLNQHKSLFLTGRAGAQDTGLHRAAEPTAANSPCVHTVRRSRGLTDIASRRYNSDVSGKQSEPAQRDLPAAGRSRCCPARKVFSPARTLPFSGVLE
jgi:hypothetical protein